MKERENERNKERNTERKKERRTRRTNELTLQVGKANVEQQQTYQRALYFDLNILTLVAVQFAYEPAHEGATRALCRCLLISTAAKRPNLVFTSRHRTAQ